jgi:hypothetical protein
MLNNNRTPYTTSFVKNVLADMIAKIVFTLSESAESRLAVSMWMFCKALDKKVRLCMRLETRVLVIIVLKRLLIRSDMILLTLLCPFDVITVLERTPNIQLLCIAFETRLTLLVDRRPPLPLIDQHLTNRRRNHLIFHRL